MGGILDKLDEWLRGLLIEGITGNLSGMFDTVNTKVGEIAGEVGQTPLAWNSGVFSMIRNLSETVIVPIAGVILTFVMCYELIQLVTEKNNLHDVDTWMFFKWIFKTFCAVLIVTNTWNIVMGIFDVGQSVVNSSAGVIIGNTSIDISSVITDMEAQLEALGTGELFGLWFQSLFVGLTMNALSICIMLVIYGRMIEVYLTKLREDAGLPKVVFHSLRHSSTTYKLKLNHGDLKATQGDTGHAEIDMITSIYAHILDEDRKVNAQKFETAFYAKPDLRNVRPPEEPAKSEPATLDLESLVEQLQKSPELASALAALIAAQAPAK